MAFYAPTLTASLVTTHVPHRDVSAALTPQSVARATYWTAWLMQYLRDAHKPQPVAVAALNPHAGEGGLIGLEEIETIAPGVALARKRLQENRIDVTVEGPVAAETVFRLAAAGRYGAVVAMYHDQATIPMKLLGFGHAVNVSLGLPIVRTSVDHGTAYDRAGRGVSDASGMVEAIKLAARLARARARHRA